MATVIDPTTELGAKASTRMEHQVLGWLTTVGSDGTPQPNPVWYIHDGETIVIFSRPNQAKLGNIRRHPQVSFNLEATETEEEVTILTGTAVLEDRTGISQELLDRFAARYERGLAGIQMTRAEFEEQHTVVIRITPAKLRGW
ncbi:MAG TPA: TIGR03618 family F420-dependent PPOX class oxidoreductase [Thermomicrobiales bacterium]|nr:TIGR03618 family F420-dependent PPOX class oxidoreductase [Thermomicrobiales bacterium]HRA49354.1 TIGR03618 family F420-dependent PPOX class oxidoreductase [Thermomicrobiales bacterium]